MKKKERKEIYISDEGKRELSSQIRLHMEEEASCLFQDDVKRRQAMSRGGRVVVILFVITVLLLVWAVVFGNVAAISGYNISDSGISIVRSGNLYDYLMMWRDTITDMLGGSEGGGLMFRQQLMGYTAILLIGVAMASAGSVYQGVFQNPLASPTTLGVTSGGVLGAAVFTAVSAAHIFKSYGEAASEFMEEFNLAADNGSGVTAFLGSDLVAFYDSLTVWQKYGSVICTAIGCFAGVALVVWVSKMAGRGKVNTVALLLAGSIFFTVASQVTQMVYSAILYNVGEEQGSAQLTEVSSLQGSESSSLLNYMEPDQFLLIAVPVAACLAVLIAMAGKLNVLMFGEEEARALGLHVQRLRVAFIVLATAMTAVIVCFCGQVAMLGFVVPHLARFLVGPDFKHLLPASALLGAVVCLVAAAVCMTTDLGLENFNTYVSVFCTVASVLFILFFRRKRHADWA